ncbi:MAG: hypothetical protein EOP82_16170 [Variovorax sp.]|nr:MAG: hypothetical protein EOP82_16170 [Variovorax sp.]
MWQIVKILWAQRHCADQARSTESTRRRDALSRAMRRTARNELTQKAEVRERRTMNKRLHRVVFNAARGLRMVLHEGARSAARPPGPRRGWWWLQSWRSRPRRRRSRGIGPHRAICAPRCSWRPTACR